MDLRNSSQNDRVALWLHTTDDTYYPLTPPPDHEPRSPSLKRKRRAMSDMQAYSSSRNETAKRQRIDENDDISPEQSASQLDRDTPLPLNRINTFSPPTSRVSSDPKRSYSPTRETPTLLRSASPPVLTESLNGLKEPLLEQVELLGDRLADRVDSRFIPLGLQVFQNRYLPVPLSNSHVIGCH